MTVTLLELLCIRDKATQEWHLPNGISQRDILVPSADGSLRNADELVFDDAPWLSSKEQDRLLFCHPKVPNEIASCVGVRSLRQSLLRDESNSTTVAYGIQKDLQNLLDSWPHPEYAVLDFLDLADSAIRCKHVQIALDKRALPRQSILHPCLSDAQTESICIHLPGVTLTRNDIVGFSIPAMEPCKLNCWRQRSGHFGPSEKTGWCSLFHLTDCLQVWSGDHLFIFDPSGHLSSSASASSECSSEGLYKYYKVDDHLLERFPDQFMGFGAFLACREGGLRLGDLQQLKNSGTFIRVPVRSKMLVNKTESAAGTESIQMVKAMDSIAKSLLDMRHSLLLFCSNLERLSLVEWVENGSDSLHLVTRFDVKVLSPELARGSQASVTENGAWKRSSLSNMASSFFGNKVKDRLSYKVRISTTEDVGENVSTAKPLQFVDEWLVFTCLAHGDAKAYALDKRKIPATNGADLRKERSNLLSKSYEGDFFLPVVATAAHISRNGGDAPRTEGRIFVELPTMLATGLPVHVFGGFHLLPSKANERHLVGDVSARRKTLGGGGGGSSDLNSGPKSTNAGTWSVESDGHVKETWNILLWTTGVLECYSSLLLTLRHSCLPKSFYQYWPYVNECSLFVKHQHLLPSKFYLGLTSQPLFLCGNNEFKTFSDGYGKPDDLDPVLEQFLDSHYSFFQTPEKLVDELSDLGVTITKLDAKELISHLRAYLVLSPILSPHPNHLHHHHHLHLHHTNLNPHTLTLTHPKGHGIA